MTSSFVERQEDWYRKESLRYCTEQCFGTIRPPQTEREAEELEGKLRALRPSLDLWHYAPHLKQRLFHEAPTQRRLFVGGNQSGKTTSLCAEVLAWCLGYRPWTRTRVVHPLTGKPVRPPVHAMIGADDFTNKVSDVLVPKLRDMLPFEIFVVHLEKIQGKAVSKIVFKNGSTIKFLSYEMHPKKWEGYTWDVVGFDEPPPRHAYIATRRGCMRRHAPLFFSFTPLSEPWIYEQLYNTSAAVHVNLEEDVARLTDPVRQVFVTTIAIEENPYLTKDQRDAFLEDLDDEEREARQHGRFLHLMGRVYKDFDPRTHVLPAMPASDWREWPAGLVVDPHDRRPFACLWFVISPRNEMFFVGEWPDFDFYHTKNFQAGVDFYSQAMSEMEGALGLQRLEWNLMDPRFGKTPSGLTGTTMMEEFRKYGRYFDEHLVPFEDIQSGHIKVRKRLKENSVFFLESCTNAIRGMRNYTWQEWRGSDEDKGVKERPAERWKDFPDCVRYAIEADLHYFEAADLTPVIDWQGIRNLGMGGRKYA